MRTAQFARTISARTRLHGDNRGNNEPTHAQIAALAYNYWLERAQERAAKDWLDAEEVLRSEGSADISPLAVAAQQSAGED